MKINSRVFSQGMIRLFSPHPPPPVPPRCCCNEQPPSGGYHIFYCSAAGSGNAAAAVVVPFSVVDFAAVVAVAAVDVATFLLPFRFAHSSACLPVRLHALMYERLVHHVGACIIFKI